MAEKVDRRVRKTKAQLRAGLARLMQKKSIKEITVKELVDEVDINRSTFYLHYSDIYQMLESIENELMDEIAQVIEEHPLDLVKNGSSYPMIEHIFTILDNNKDICIALLGSNGDMGFVSLNGCVGMIKAWLSSEHRESTKHIAELTNRMIENTTHDFLRQIPNA